MFVAFLCFLISWFLLRIDYPRPSWLFFQGIEAQIILLILALPAFCAICLHFTTAKHAINYLLSDYFGLVFFSPEITEKRNISMKIYTFMIQFCTLIFYSFYFMSLEGNLGDLSSYGGHSFDEDGMFEVNVWCEDQFVGTVMNDLYIPRSVGYEYLDLSDYQAFIEENPGDYYLMTSVFANALQSMSKSTNL